jgi:membrane-anchored mycosin MYCP
MGVAPDATIIAIRQSSRAFEPKKSLNSGARAGTIESLAAAIVHAANLGAKVINISVTSCVAAESVGQQGALAAAIWYAATQKDAVIVTAAGNVTDSGDIGGEKCRQNPLFDPLDTSGDVRDWHQAETVSLPSWFSDYVLSVGAVDANGVVINKSLAGPWVGVAAPGVGVTGLSPQGGKPVNATPPINGQPAERLWGTSFSAAYVSGVAALVRAKYPQLSAHQIIERIIRTAHNPPAGVDNAVGYGVVDPVAALTHHIDVSADRTAPVPQERLLVPPPPPQPADTRARNIALSTFAVVVAAVVLAWGWRGARNRAMRALTATKASDTGAA